VTGSGSKVEILRAAPEGARVLLLHVGGTIGMVRDGRDRWVPQAGFLANYLASMPELSAPGMPAYELETLDPLLDSADMRPSDWVRIAARIAEVYDRFDGFVIVHGTDTMAYTASALSFLLRGGCKPVVLTGSQLSLVHPRTDGRGHLVTSLLLAGGSKIPEVTIAFSDRVLRGNRAQKVQSHEFVAFRSGNYPALAKLGVEIEIRRHLVRAPGTGLSPSLELSRGPGSGREPEIVSLRVYPGLRARALQAILDAPIDGLVLETYGTGNAPTRDGELVATLAKVIRDRDLVVLNCSQCHGGSVHQGLYGSGGALADAGVTSGRDLTPEAGLTKLYCAFASGMDAARVRAWLGADVAGECTAEVSP
jgi:L-asparaginase